MQTVAQPLPITPSIDQLARIIGNVAAPAFLLGAVAALISVLMSRLNRVIDRSQFIYSIPKGDAGRSFSRPICLGLALVRQKRSDDALEELRRAATLDPSLSAGQRRSTPIEKLRRQTSDQRLIRLLDAP